MSKLTSLKVYDALNNTNYYEDFTLYITYLIVGQKLPDFIINAYSEIELETIKVVLKSLNDDDLVSFVLELKEKAEDNFRYFILESKRNFLLNSLINKKPYIKDNYSISFKIDFNLSTTLIITDTINNFSLVQNCEKITKKDEIFMREIPYQFLNFSNKKISKIDKNKMITFYNEIDLSRKFNYASQILLKL